MKYANSALKNHLSVFELFIRTTFIPVLLTAAAVVFSQCAVCWVYLTFFFHQTLRTLPAPELVMEQSLAPLPAGLGLLLLTWLLTRTGDDRYTKAGYTLRRLSVSHRSILLIQTVYNALCYFLYWAAMLLGVLLMYRIYLFTFGETAVTSQTLALGFFRCSYLHGLLPISEPISLMLNFFLVAVLGFLSASAPYFRRIGDNRTPKIWFLAAWTVYCIPRGMIDHRHWTLAVMTILLFLYGVYHLCDGTEGESL